MAQQYSSGYCKHCRELVKIERKRTNHILHFIVTISTALLWAPIWIFLSVQLGGWGCCKCGIKRFGL